MSLPHRKHTYGSPQPVMRIALLFYMLMMFVPHGKHIYGPPLTVTDIALLFYKYTKTALGAPLRAILGSFTRLLVVLVRQKQVMQ
jgi:hypothetical protein